MDGRDFSFISFTPLPNEPALDFIDIDRVIHTIAPDRSADPLEVARQVAPAGGKVAILIPGTHFDTVGTRHGRGGGWYDRFLSAIPQDWARIGVCFEDQVSEEPLMRESWDEPVDYLIVRERTGPGLQYVLTKARPTAGQDAPKL